MMPGRARFRGFSSFRARVFWFVVPILVSFVVFQGWVNVREHRRLVTEEFEKRGRALASNLGFASELGAFSEDRQLLEAAMRGTIKNPDVAYVVIHGTGGRVLASGGRRVTIEAPLERVPIDQPLSRHVEHGGQPYIEFAAPIVAERRPTADAFRVGMRLGPGDAEEHEEIIGGVTVGLSLAGVEVQTRSLARLWGGITVVFLVISTLIVYGLSRYITKPVKQLTQQAQKIAAGRLEEQIAVRSRDEIGQLASAFNRMTHSLQLSMSDQARARAELEGLNRTLEELNRTLEGRIRERTVELEERGIALERSLREVRALGEVSRTIGSSLDLAGVLTTVADHARRLAAAEACGIFEAETPRARLAVVASVGLDESALSTLERAPVSAGTEDVDPIEQALADGQTVQVSDIAMEVNLARRDEYLRVGFRALLALPIGRTGASHTVVVFRRAPGPWDHRALELLATLANQSRVAIDNARLFRELENRSRLLAAASRHKSDFLANVSHELRTPMNAILGFNEMILDQVYGEVPEDLRRPLVDIQQSGQHLLRLINDVLDLSKIEAGRMELALGEYSVPDIVTTVRIALGSLAAEKNLELVVAVPEEIPVAYGDGKRITQCLMNYVGNALKFTRQGRVTIAVERLDEVLRFSVSDTGIGIPPERIDSLFVEFQQGDASIGREFGGTGLGLSITRRFVEMHGGRAWVESELGRGSTFFFAIPLRVGAGAA
jgi:signal transduction histidine kinase/HAMP domain-containing protein